MTPIYFMNNGEFDITAMVTFGVSVKKKGSIGFFGTGFKYAVAIITRLGGKVTITTKEQEYVFGSITKEVKGDSFNIITLNGDELGFTTHLGHKWDNWQAFRELYCNCTDEGGEISTELGDYEVIIKVECDQIEEEYYNREDYFLQKEPIVSLPDVEIMEGSMPFLYYRGTAVEEGVESPFTFNVLSKVDLTEDRTAKYTTIDMYMPIAYSIQTLTDKSLIRNIIQGEGDFKDKLPFSYDSSTSGEFIGVCRELLRSGRAIPESALQLLKDLDIREGNWVDYSLNLIQERQLEKAKEFLKKINIDVEQFEIRVVIGLGDGVMGRASDGVIYLSEIPFQMGTKQVASTLMEEWVHNKYGCKDFDYEMQSWLFDKILSLAEELRGDPL